MKGTADDAFKLIVFKYSSIVKEIITDADASKMLKADASPTTSPAS